MIVTFIFSIDGIKRLERKGKQIRNFRLKLPFIAISPYDRMNAQDQLHRIHEAIALLNYFVSSISPLHK